MVRHSLQNGRRKDPCPGLNGENGTVQPPLHCASLSGSTREASGGDPGGSPPLPCCPSAADAPATPEALGNTGPGTEGIEPRGAGTTRLLSLGALASGMLRDFNNVMCAVMGFAQLLHQELDEQLPASSPGAGYVRQILRAGRYGRSMSERLLAYAEGEGGGAAAVDLRGVVDQAFDLVQHLIGGHIRLSQSHAETPLVVEAEPYQLEYAVIALLLGACDAMPAGGHLRLETRRIVGASASTGSPWACIAVTDTGIPPTDEADGLSLVRTLVAQHGGTMAVHPARAEGNVVEVHLPVNALADDTAGTRHRCPGD